MTFTLQLIPLIWEVGQNFLQNFTSIRDGPVKRTETRQEWKHTRRLPYYILLDKSFRSNWNQLFGMQVHKCDKCEKLQKCLWSHTAPRLQTHCWYSDYRYNSQSCGLSWTWDKPCQVHEENSLSYMQEAYSAPAESTSTRYKPVQRYCYTGISWGSAGPHTIAKGNIQLPYIHFRNILTACMLQTCNQA